MQVTFDDILKSIVASKGAACWDLRHGGAGGAHVGSTHHPTYDTSSRNFSQLKQFIYQSPNLYNRLTHTTHSKYLPISKIQPKE
jgi:hypothetical protein